MHFLYVVKKKIFKAFPYFQGIQNFFRYLALKSIFISEYGCGFRRILPFPISNTLWLCVKPTRVINCANGGIYNNFYAEDSLEEKDIFQENRMILKEILENEMEHILSFLCAQHSIVHLSFGIFDSKKCFIKIFNVLSDIKLWFSRCKNSKSSQHESFGNVKTEYIRTILANIKISQLFSQLYLHNIKLQVRYSCKITLTLYFIQSRMQKFKTTNKKKNQF